MSQKPGLILGTAMWGWTLDREACFELLDQFYAAGLKEVDTATNYPINKKPADFRRAESILLEWIKAHQVIDLKVMMKVGSINNLRSPEHQLNKSFLLYNLEDYWLRFGSNLDTFMIHWDNRSDAEEVKESLDAFQVAQDQGLRLGLSGIRHPEIYAGLNQAYGFRFRIQCKHNLLYSDYPRYAPLHQQAEFIAYGINAGGIKLDQAAYGTKASLEVRGGDLSEPSIATPLRQLIAQQDTNSDRPPVESMNHCGLIYAYFQEGMTGILVGPSKPEQLSDSLNWINYFQQFDYQDIYQQLSQLKP